MIKTHNIVVQPQESLIYLFNISYKCAVFKCCPISLGVCGSGGLFGHKAELAVRILGG